jgi:hypothetical protein
MMKPPAESVTTATTSRIARAGTPPRVELAA